MRGSTKALCLYSGFFRIRNVVLIGVLYEHKMYDEIFAPSVELCLSTTYLLSLLELHFSFPGLVAGFND